jgi:antagonist of KipI
MTLLVHKEGILNTIQDLGRTGYRKFGVNAGGVMDRAAARLANLVLENAESAPVIEMHFPAGEFIFESGVEFAVCGADFSPKLNGREIHNWAVHSSRKGDVLSFGRRISGQRAYLAVSGGLLIESWLGSSSTNLTAEVGGFKGRRLRSADRIPLQLSTGQIESRDGIAVGRSLIPPYSASPRIRITPGPEFDQLAGASIDEMFKGKFQITRESNRMGFRLAGPRLYLLSEAEMISSAVAFGTVQRLPDGQLIVLMADHQTTGGYPRIANIAAVDLPLMAQLGPGDEFSFQLIETDRAEELMLDTERGIETLRVGLRMKMSGVL